MTNLGGANLEMRPEIYEETAEYAWLPTAYIPRIIEYIDFAKL
jgi:hypothetical protein